MPPRRGERPGALADYQRSRQLGQTQPFVKVQGDPDQLPSEEKRTAGLILEFLAKQIEGPR